MQSPSHELTPHGPVMRHAVYTRVVKSDHLVGKRVVIRAPRGGAYLLYSNQSPEKFPIRGFSGTSHGGGGLPVASAPGGRPGSPAHLRSRSRSSAAHPRPLARIYLHPQLLRRPGNNDTTLQCDNDLKSGTGCSMSPPTAVPSNLHAVFATNGTERASAHAAAEEIHSACSTSLRGASALKSGTGLTDLTAGQQIRGQ